MDCNLMAMASFSGPRSTPGSRRHPIRDADVRAVDAEEKPRLSKFFWVLVVSTCSVFATAGANPPVHSPARVISPAPTEAAFTESQWREPAKPMRPLARWWWPGGSVDAEVLDRELGRIEAAGFSGVEVQPLLLGIGDDDLAADPRLRSVGEPAFRGSVAVAARSAEKRGLAFDLTLGSGWPGGLPTSKANAERQLLMAFQDVSGPSRFDGPLPPAPDQSYRSSVEWVLDVLGPQDLEARLTAVIAARLGGEREGLPILAEVRDLAGFVKDDGLVWEMPAGNWRIFAFYENSTEHFVMGGAFPGAEADARVVDHLSVRGADALLEGYAAPVLAALRAGQVRELFVDSFELMGELPFTRELLDAFEAQNGYALTPHLPLVFRNGGESKYAEMMDFFGSKGGALYRSSKPGRDVRIREDYVAVRSALFEDRFIERLVRWSHEHGLLLRLQAHGGYADYLDVYARSDIPESEALFGRGSFDFLKLASSAAHVAGRRGIVRVVHHAATLRDATERGRDAAARGSRVCGGDQSSDLSRRAVSL
jgi:hypothetical protein